MYPPSFSLLYAVYGVYLLDCFVGIRLLRGWKLQENASRNVLPLGFILSRAFTTAVLTGCLLQIVEMNSVERWVCVGLSALSLTFSAVTLVQRAFLSRVTNLSPSNADAANSSVAHIFPINPHFEALWAADPQYYDAGGIRLRKVQLPHWQYESPEFTDVLFVLEGAIMVETAIGSPDGVATRHAVDLVWQIAEEMNIRHSRAVLYSDAFNVRKSTFEARKIAGLFYGEAATIWDCYLFLNPSVRVMFRLSKPFAPSAFRSIRIADSFNDGIRDILSLYAHTVPANTEAWQTHEYSFPTNPFFEEYWKYSLEYFEYKGVKLRKIQPAQWRYQAMGGELTVLMLEGVIIIIRVNGKSIDIATVQAMMSHVGQLLLQNGNETIPMTLMLDFSDVQIDATLPWADVAQIFHQNTLLQVYCIASPFLRMTGQASQTPDAPIAEDNTIVSFVSTQDEALDAMLAHFLASPNEESSVPMEQSSDTVRLATTDYHERRIEQIYTLLARIADNDPETLEPPQLPSSDLYADVFKAMEMVYEDKRRQMQEILGQKYLLEKQAAHIQEVNTQLSFHNSQLDEQNQQLAALNHEKNELMSIVAHDLKNPIGAVRTMAGLIADGYVQTPKETADNIVNTANRMLALVGNLLDINRLESGAMAFHCVEIDIAPYLETTIWQYRHAAEKKNITFHYAAETDSTLALADEQAILQIIDNLISNAVKYSPEGKNIVVKIKDGLSETISFLRFEVQDEGEGISNEDMKRLFGKFVRLSAQPTGGEHSTGLGLSIVKKMVEAMQGRVWCESDYGKGSTFIVELPKTSSGAVV
jgi:signal transduction histidine kinase